MKFLSMNDFDFAGKKVLVRLDVNSPVDEKKRVQISDRILSASSTLKELSDRGAKVVVLAHQGRPGDKDYTELDQHVVLLNRAMGKEVRYVDDLTGKAAIDAIDDLENGQILVLKNVRSLKSEMAKISAEEHSRSDFVKALEPHFVYFINDAFSVSHRSQCSVVGFRNIPNIAGRNMEAELQGLSRIERMERPCVFVFGGAKPDEVLMLLKAGIARGNVDRFLTSGFIGFNLLLARGVEIGKTKDLLVQNGALVEGLKEVIDSGKDRIDTPIDFAIEKEGARVEISISSLPVDSFISDIGENTARHYAEIIKSAKTVYYKGPQGVIEDVRFRKGTEIVLNAIVESGAFSIMGGGHSLKALADLGIDKSKIGYISLAGGALVEFIAGEKLPGITALEESYDKFKK